MRINVYSQELTDEVGLDGRDVVRLTKAGNALLALEGRADRCSVCGATFEKIAAEFRNAEPSGLD